MTSAVGSPPVPAAPGRADASRSWRPRPGRVARLRRRSGLVTVALLSLAVVAYTLFFYSQGTLAEIAAADEDGQAIAGSYVGAPLVVQASFYLHIVTGALALVLGPAQFSRRLRVRSPRVHRVLGRGYFIAVGLASVTSLVIAPFNSAGLVGTFGFGALGVLWFVTGWRALAAIRRGDIKLHRSWMIRNYALSFAAPTLRLWLGLLIVGQILLANGEIEFAPIFDNAYAAVPFLCWIPNLVVAEWLVRRRGLPAYRLV
ncbi:DUF2306 domain-containing protein [Sanguibacter sp. A247]|uniref:DUF2306 domain-containing protein n=1 Tax=unclassified Sanguibacter TaxID=2645534 RepID=UPI003FD8A528